MFVIINTEKKSFSFIVSDFNIRSHFLSQSTITSLRLRNVNVTMGKFLSVQKYISSTLISHNGVHHYLYDVYTSMCTILFYTTK